MKLGATLIAVEPTDDEGAVQFDNLKPGAYEIVVSKDGFESLKTSDVTLASNTTLMTRTLVSSWARNKRRLRVDFDIIF